MQIIYVVVCEIKANEPQKVLIFLPVSQLLVPGMEDKFKDNS